MTHFNLRFFKAKYGEKLKVRQNMLIYRQLLKWNEFMKKNYSTAPNDIPQQSPRVKSGTSLKSQQRNHNETSTKKNNEEACDLNRTTPTVNGERWTVKRGTSTKIYGPNGEMGTSTKHQQLPALIYGISKKPQQPTAKHGLSTKSQNQSTGKRGASRKIHKCQWRSMWPQWNSNIKNERWCMGCQRKCNNVQPQRNDHH